MVKILGPPQNRATMEQQQQQQRGEGNCDGEGEDLTTRVVLLPKDVLADEVLCRLSPRDLAACRCVCSEWKCAIDGRRLLRADLLPLSIVGGIFFNLARLWYAELFRPASAKNLYPACIDYGWFGGTIEDHCNGLVLLGSCVGNPATGWFAPLPPCPPEPSSFYYHRSRYLVFDPAGSSQLHYSVFIVDYAPLYDDGEVQAIDQDAAAEWPPSPYLLHVFSSSTGQWEERPFLRQGHAVGTIADVRLGQRTYSERRCFATYWKQALYVHCHNDFFLRISLSKDEYRAIKPPPGIGINSPQIALVLGKSEKGPYLAEMIYPDRCLKVWILDESSNHESSEWVLRHCNKHLGIMLPRCYLDNKLPGPWILEDINYNNDRKTCTSYAAADDMGAAVRILEQGETIATAAAAPVLNKQQSAAECSCGFDEDDFTLDSSISSRATEDDGTSCCYIRDLWVIGFHPYKENIVFLGSGANRALAYDMNSSKSQYLGNIHPTHFDPYSVEEDHDIDEIFVYTPCKLDPRAPLGRG